MRDLFVHSGGVRLGVRDYGGEGHPLEFVHGGPGPNLASWDAFARRMSADFRCVAYDQRGHGQSDDAEDYSYAALASDIAAIVDTLGLEGTVVVGHSWGGLIAPIYAALFPERCAGVVSVDGLITGEPMRELTEADWVWLENELRTNPVFQRTASFVGAPADLEDLVAWLREEARVHYPEFSEQAFLRDVIAGPDGLLRGHHSVEGLMALNRAVAGQEPPSTDVYGRIRCPVMLVMGTRGMFPREEVERVGRLYPRLRVEWLDCGHVPQAERPDELAALVAEFAFSLPSA